MVNIVRSEGGTEAAQPVGASTGNQERAPSLAVDGRAIQYATAEFDIPQSWALLSPKMQAWATDRAGEPIVDPVTKRERCYRWCSVVRAGDGWDDSSPAAEYQLVMFGKRGLVVAYGVTTELVPEAGATRWRTSRWDLPIDPEGVRHDHRSGARPNTAAATGLTAPHTPGPAAADGAGHDRGARALLDSGTASELGNLPAETQTFLLEPFARSGTEPQDAGVQALHSVVGRRETEELWVYLFNKRWVGFSYARRSAHRQGRHTGLGGAPWDLAAWVAPARPPEPASLTA